MTPRDEVLGNDDLLIAVFGRLDLKDRHRLLPFVCQRWKNLLVSPQLLRHQSMYLRFHEDKPSLLPRMRALCGFLQQHGGFHLSKLDIWFPGWNQLPAKAYELRIEAISACAHSLEELTLHGDSLCVGGWLAAMSRLRSVRLEASGSISVVAPLTTLTRLKELVLGARYGGVLFESSAALPALLTYLQLRPRQPNHALPAQLATLTSLWHLCLCGEDVGAAGFNLLRNLPALRMLDLRDPSDIPACLSQLTALESLCVAGMYVEEAVELGPLAAALPHLRRLTQLVLEAASEEVFAVLPSLTQLRDFRCRGCDDVPPLPCGEWLRGLRCIGLPVASMQASLPALTAAGAQLERAEVYGDEWWELEDLLPCNLCVNFRDPNWELGFAPGGVEDDWN